MSEIFLHLNLKIMPQTTKLMYFFNKYKYLAKTHATKIYGSEKLGMDYEDIVQELEIKIYTSIIAYAKKWSAYRKTGNYKPVPLHFFIKTTLNNKIFTFSKKTKQNIALPINYKIDYGKVDNTDSIIDLDNRKAVVNGFDLLCGLEGAEKDCYVLWLKGYKFYELNSMFDFNTSIVVNSHNEWLGKFKDKLYVNTQKTEFVLCSELI